MMKRLDFRLHDFTRVSWVSDQARDIWQSRIQRIVASWQEIEWLSVADGMRPCAVKIVPSESIQELTEQVSKYQLLALPLEKCSLSTSSYSAIQVDPVPG